MKTIDFENHFYVPDFFETLSKRTVQPYYDPETDLLARIDSEIGMIKLPQAYSAPWLMEMGQNRVDALNEWRIDRAILSPAPGMESIADEDAVTLSRAHNDALAELCREFPDRFWGRRRFPSTMSTSRSRKSSAA